LERRFILLWNIKLGNKNEIEEEGGRRGGFWTDAWELSVQKREIWTDKKITGPEVRNMGDKINYRSENEICRPIKKFIDPKTGFTGR